MLAFVEFLFVFLRQREALCSSRCYEGCEVDFKRLYRVQCGSEYCHVSQTNTGRSFVHPCNYGNGSFRVQKSIYVFPSTDMGDLFSLFAIIVGTG